MHVQYAKVYMSCTLKYNKCNYAYITYMHEYSGDFAVAILKLYIYIFFIYICNMMQVKLKK